MMTLVTEVIVRAQKSATVKFFMDDIDRALDLMDADGKIGLLEYGCPQGGDNVRQKMFVYLPLENEEETND